MYVPTNARIFIEILVYLLFCFSSDVTKDTFLIAIREIVKISDGFNCPMLLVVTMPETKDFSLFSLLHYLLCACTCIQHSFLMFYCLIIFGDKYKL
jgi:hypothetical protein